MDDPYMLALAIVVGIASVAATLWAAFTAPLAVLAGM